MRSARWERSSAGHPNSYTELSRVDVPIVFSEDGELRTGEVHLSGLEVARAAPFRHGFGRDR